MSLNNTEKLEIQNRLLNVYTIIRDKESFDNMVDLTTEKDITLPIFTHLKKPYDKIYPYFTEYNIRQY